MVVKQLLGLIEEVLEEVGGGDLHC
jgi:hypothetical protein